MKSFITLSVATLAVFAVSAQAEIKGYRCFGTEPFYGLDINGANLTLEMLGEDPISYQVSGPTAPIGIQDGYVSVYRAPDKDAVVSIVSGTCSDGMSDNEYGYHVVYVEGERVLYGCCEPLAQD
ncbi:MAG: COG3650 family protein [Bdellovibrionales bacterium]